MRSKMIRAVIAVASLVLAGGVVGAVSVQANPVMYDGALMSSVPLKFDGVLAKVPVDTAKQPTGVHPGYLPSHLPPLRRVLVFAVGSSRVGWERMTRIHQWSTVYHHGGAHMRVVMQDIGFGGPRYAQFRSWPLPSWREYYDLPICIHGRWYTTSCSYHRDLTVGYYRFFNLDGYGYSTPGRFYYHNRSYNSPWNTLYTSIWIR